MFNIQLKEAEDNLSHINYVQECIKKMKEIKQDMLLFEQLGLIGEKESISFAMTQEIKGLENKLTEGNR